MRGLSSRESALDEVGDRDAPAGSRPWSVWIIGQAKLQRSRLDHDAYLMRDLIDRIRRHEAWRALGSDSLESLCRRDLRLDPEQVDAVLAAKRGQALGAVLGTHGGDRRSEVVVDQPDNVSLKTYGNSREYQLARLQRDHQNILADLNAGKYPSVRQAAIAAGIVRVPSQLDVLRRAWRKASDDERGEFLDWLQANA